MVYNLDAPIRTKMFGHIFQPKGAWHNGTRLKCTIVIYCTDGVMQMQLENQLFRVEKGDLLVIPPDMRYRPLDGGACGYYFFHIDATLLPENTDLPLPTVIFPHTGLLGGYAYTCGSTYNAVVAVPHQISSAPYAITGLFESAAKLKPNRNFSDQLLLDHIGRELLIRMGDIVTPKHKRLTDILQYIDHHYAEPIRLSALAAHFCVSESYLARLFREQLALKPSEYINQVRVSVATTLLSETNLSVTQIAERTGFSDVYYFSRTFKKITGLPPRALRERK